MGLDVGVIEALNAAIGAGAPHVPDSNGLIGSDRLENAWGQGVRNAVRGGHNKRAIDLLINRTRWIVCCLEDFTVNPHTADPVLRGRNNSKIILEISL